MTLPEHFMVSDCDGSLLDTRKADWSKHPVRANYSRHHHTIDTLADAKACLRAGEWAWPGGYRLAFTTIDGGVLSFEAVREEWHQVVWDFLHDASTGWRVEGLIDVDNMDGEVWCAHTGELLNPRED